IQHPPRPQRLEHLEGIEPQHLARITDLALVAVASNAPLDLPAQSLEVEVWGASVAGVAHLGDDPLLAHLVALSDQDLLAVCIPIGDAWSAVRVGRMDCNDVAIAISLPIPLLDLDDRTVGHRQDLGVRWGVDFDALVEVKRRLAVG